MLVGTHAEVLDGLTCVLGTTEDQGVGTGGGTEGKLVESDGLTAGSEDASAGGGGEAESSHGQLGDRQETVVIGHGADNHDGSLLLLGSVGDQAAERNRGAVDLGHKEASENNLVEAGIGSAWWLKAR